MTEEQEYDFRQYSRMLEYIENCPRDMNSLYSLSGDLEGLCNALVTLEDNNWRREFKNLCNQFELMYAVALSEDREFFTDEDLQDSEEALKDIKSMIIPKFEYFRDLIIKKIRSLL